MEDLASMSKTLEFKSQWWEFLAKTTEGSWVKVRGVVMVATILGGSKKDNKKMKYETLIPNRVGEKEEEKGPDAAHNLPLVMSPNSMPPEISAARENNRLSSHGGRSHRNQKQIKIIRRKARGGKIEKDDLRGTPSLLEPWKRSLMRITPLCPHLWAQILSFVHKDLLESGCSVLLSHKMRAVVGVLMDGTDLLVTVMTPHPLENLHRYWGD